ncbi:hypothetical protein [Lacipirellula parvula]|uniref:hypothetical protein n=1 Tax=Lacipirellula parvula TaxID=2650471 RepID=UPI0015628E5E|nr:hypothetical protein [Lacipirellula parvula]
MTDRSVEINSEILSGRFIWSIRPPSHTHAIDHRCFNQEADRNHDRRGQGKRLPESAPAAG